MNEEKIREAFRKYTMGEPDYEQEEPAFFAGYLAMLNSLERAGGCGGMELYYLPEGATK